MRNKGRKGRKGRKEGREDRQIFGLDSISFLWVIKVAINAALYLSKEDA